MNKNILIKYSTKNININTKVGCYILFISMKGKGKREKGKGKREKGKGKIKKNNTKLRFNGDIRTRSQNNDMQNRRFTS